ncbi:hypothetical protein OG607_41395 [Streptomyces sp. NBC_01537]|uniref:hypothetical protein n=1 Tax=Streptomyces sp. NBC_01537 TaxID=2903896 RepID=UPI00386C6689
MRKRLSISLSGYGAGWSANRRILIVALVLSGLLAVAGLAAWFTGRSDQRHDTGSPTATTNASPSEATTRPAPSSSSVPAPPQIADPLAYAKAAAAMLWSYDSRTASRDEQLAGMNAWMTAETKYTDWSSISAQVPDPVLWSRMADNDQHATASVTEAHFPSAFKQALAEDPTAITTAYIYAVTVTGKQHIAWKKGGNGAEERSITLAVQCRPSHDCALVSIAPWSPPDPPRP